MGFFERFPLGGNVTMPEPKLARFKTKPDTIYVPVTGLVVPFGKTGDKTFDQGIFGVGTGISPESGVLYAPADGRISATTVTNHAIGMTTADGAEVIIHIGIDTVKMNGKGFQRFVEAGETVVAGQPLIAFDREKIASAGYDDIVIVSVTNVDEKYVQILAKSGTKIDGKYLVKVGEPLLEVAE